MVTANSEAIQIVEGIEAGAVNAVELIVSLNYSNKFDRVHETANQVS